MSASLRPSVAIRSVRLILGFVLLAASASAQILQQPDLSALSPLFPPDNWWNVDVSGAPLDPTSFSFINFIGATRGLHPDFGGDVNPGDPNSTATYGVPYSSVPGTQPLERVTFVEFDDQSDHGAPGRPLGYPIPVAARTQGDPATFLPAIRQAVREVDANLPIFNVKTQVDQVTQSLAQERLFASLLSFFGVLALGLAALGLYGVLANSVAQRTQEIGIRMALGANARNVLRLVIGQGVRLVCVGLATGLLVAFWLTKWLASWLYGVGVTDPLTFGAIAALLLLVAVGACYIPARRATKVDPLVALRYE